MLLNFALRPKNWSQFMNIFTLIYENEYISLWVFLSHLISSNFSYFHCVHRIVSLWYREAIMNYFPHYRHAKTGFFAFHCFRYQHDIFIQVVLNVCQGLHSYIPSCFDVRRFECQLIRVYPESTLYMHIFHVFNFCCTLVIEYIGSQLCDTSFCKSTRYHQRLYF